MGSFWQPRNQPGSKDRIHWNLMLEWVVPPIASRRLPSKQRHTPPSSRAPVPPGRELEVLSIFSHRNSTHKQAPLDAHLSACRDFSVQECAGSGLLPMLAGACRYSCAPALAGSVAAPGRDQLPAADGHLPPSQRAPP